MINASNASKKVVFKAEDDPACNSKVTSVLHPNKSVVRSGHSSDRIQINSQSLSPPKQTSSSDALLLKAIPELIKNNAKLDDQQVMQRLRNLAKAMEEQIALDYWTTAAGQKHLEKLAAGGASQLSIFDDAPNTKASLMPMTNQNGEWQEIELTADTGACDTVIPKSWCACIPVVPSPQSIQGMEYEVATGESIPNLGERRCEMWTEAATQPKAITMQVADVHKALLSLSRCADMGFESRFGAAFGCLIDRTSGEIIPLQRRGNLYILKAWIRAAPFRRPDGNP